MFFSLSKVITELPPSMPRPVSYSGSYVDPTSATDCADTTVGPDHVTPLDLPPPTSHLKLQLYVWVTLVTLSLDLLQSPQQNTQHENFSLTSLLTGLHLSLPALPAL